MRRIPARICLRDIYYGKPGLSGLQHSAFGIPGFKRSTFCLLGFKRSAFGFTLAELLIALAILGVIATFVIPKLLQAGQDQKQKAVMKESLAALEVIMQEYARDYYLYGSAVCKDKVNAIKICSDSLAEGCWTSDMAATGESDERGFILSNGAYITGVCSNTVNWDGFAVDWNGPAPPNSFGQDTYNLSSCMDRSGCSGGGVFGRLMRNSDYKRAFQ